MLPTYDSSGLLHCLQRQIPTGTTDYHVFYLAGRPVGQVALESGQQERWWYFTTDHLGTPVVATDSNQDELWMNRLDPFGEDPMAGTQDGASEQEIFLRFPGQWDDPVWREAMMGAEGYQNVWRWYAPRTGRYSRPDPLGLQVGLNLYRYVRANPLRFSDPKGLAIYVCSRAAWGLFGVANHSYLWDDSDGTLPGERYCGVWSDAEEAGPGTDACNYVPGSDGREGQVMNCCRFEKKHQGVFYIPFINDCQTGTQSSLDCAGLKNPGIPGGRLGLPCDECNIAPHQSKSGPASTTLALSVGRVL